MLSKSRGAVSILVAAILLAGCTTSLPEIDKRIVGIGPSLDQVPGAIAKVFIVHGIGCHSPTYSFELQEALARQLGYTDHLGSHSSLVLYKDGDVAYYGSTDLSDPKVVEAWRRFCSDPQRLMNASPVLLSRSFRRQQDDGQPEKKLIFYELTWSALTSKRRLQELAYDSSEAVVRKRAYLNRRIKQEVLNELLADAVIYLGHEKATIQKTMVRALCHMWRSDEVPIEARCSLEDPNTVSTIQAQLDDASTRYYLITFSLGSKLTMDTLGRIGKDERLRDLPTKMLSRTNAFFMLANQLPLLALAGEPRVVQRATIGATYVSQADENVNDASTNSVEGQSAAIEEFKRLAAQITRIVEGDRSTEGVDLDSLDELFNRYRQAAEEALFQTTLREQLLTVTQSSERLSYQLRQQQSELTALDDDLERLARDEGNVKSQADSWEEQRRSADRTHQNAVAIQRSRQAELDEAIREKDRANTSAASVATERDKAEAMFTVARQAHDQAVADMQTLESTIRYAEEDLAVVQSNLQALRSNSLLERVRTNIRVFLDYLLTDVAACSLALETQVGDAAPDKDERSCVERVLAKHEVTLSERITRDQSALGAARAESTNLEEQLRKAEQQLEMARASALSADRDAQKAERAVMNRQATFDQAQTHVAETHLGLSNARDAAKSENQKLQAIQVERKRSIYEHRRIAAEIKETESQQTRIALEVDRIDATLAASGELGDFQAFQSLVSLSRANAHREIVKFVKGLKEIRLAKTRENRSDPVFDKLLEEEQDLRRRGEDLMIQVVAISDPNDPLSYGISPQDLNSPGDIDFVNVEIDIAPEFLGIYADPFVAHEGHIHDDRVIKLIACGVGEIGLGESNEGLAIKDCGFPVGQ